MILLKLIISKNNDPRAMDTSVIKREADLLEIANIVINSLESAYAYLKSIVSENDLLIVSGSFVTVAEFKCLFYHF